MGQAAYFFGYDVRHWRNDFVFMPALDSRVLYERCQEITIRRRHGLISHFYGKMCDSPPRPILQEAISHASDLALIKTTRHDVMSFSPLFAQFCLSARL